MCKTTLEANDRRRTHDARQTQDRRVLQVFCIESIFARSLRTSYPSIKFTATTRSPMFPECLLHFSGSHLPQQFQDFFNKLVNSSRLLLRWQHPAISNLFVDLRFGRIGDISLLSVQHNLIDFWGRHSHPLFQKLLTPVDVIGATHPTYTLLYDHRRQHFPYNLNKKPYRKVGRKNIVTTADRTAIVVSWHLLTSLPTRHALQNVPLAQNTSHRHLHHIEWLNRRAWNSCTNHGLPFLHLGSHRLVALFRTIRRPHRPSASFKPFSRYSDRKRAFSTPHWSACACLEKWVGVFSELAGDKCL